MICAPRFNDLKLDSPTRTSHLAALQVLLLILCPGSTASAGPQDDQDSAAVQEADPLPHLGVELAALAGNDGLTFAELDDLLLWRYGRSPDGLAALRQLLELRVLEEMADAQGIVITSKDITRRWSQLEADLRTTGVAENLPAYLEASGIERGTFIEYLRLALVHEALTRAALGLKASDPVSGEQQTTWLDSVLAKRGVEELPRPWDKGPVARSGAVEISAADYAAHLRKMLPPEDMTKACHQLLLARRVRARMPDLSEQAMARLVEEEIAKRRTSTEADPRYQGVTYERLLEAQGLSLEAVRRDPALRVTVLGRRWIERTYDDEAQRQAYEADRETFDGAYGEGAETFALALQAALLPSDLVPRTLEKADEELIALRARIGSLEDFVRLATELSEDPVSRERGGRLGIVTRNSTGVPASVRKAVFSALDAARSAGVESVSGTILGPIRFPGGSLLIALGSRRPAPTWEEMSRMVRAELRRRFLVELLPPASVVTWLDQ